MTSIRLTVASVSGARRRYARKLRRKAGIRSKRLVRAFAEVPREKYLGPGPWKLLIPQREFRKRGPGYWLTPDANPRRIYDDVLVGIIPERFLNNGQPSGLASWLDWLDPRPGERVVHVGCGTGYYTAILAHAVSPAGAVTAIEIDDELVPRARANLAHLKSVTVVHGDGFALDLGRADVIFVNAGSTRPSAKWLDALRPGGRLLFPLITTHLVKPRELFTHRGGKVRRQQLPFQGRLIGVMIGITREGERYAASTVSTVGIFPCVTAIDRDEDAVVARALELGGCAQVRSLRRDEHQPDDTCWLHGREMCLSKCDPA